MPPFCPATVSACSQSAVRTLRPGAWLRLSGLLRLISVLLAFALGLAVQTAGAQTVYGVGTSGANNRLFSVNPATGAATNLCGLGLASAANGVSPIDGQVYYIESGAGANPDLRRVNPANCADAAVGATNLVGTIIRMTFCPDGRLYAASNTGTNTNDAASVYIWEISPTTGQRIRRITLTNVRVEGSGDFSCVNNGDLYVLANATRGDTDYRLYRVTSAALQGAANNGAVAATGIGTDLNRAGTPNGLTEVSTVVTGCNTNIATYPCLIASTGAGNETWGINTQTGQVSLIGAPGFVLNDLSRSFPVNAVVTKTRTSAATVQQGSNLTVTYVITVTNGGPGLAAGGTNVTDTLDPAVFNAAGASWTCSVTNAGSATTVTTACGAASGSGNINQTVVLSRNAVLTYILSVPVLSSFNGTATNAATLTLVDGITDPVPGNNTGTATTLVTPATVLTISKTNSTSTLVAGASTTYVLTVANTGLADADNAALRDPDVNGLACTQVACTSATGNGATCPAAGNVTIANLQNMAAGGGILLPNFPSGSTLTFTLSCGVDATGS